MTKPAVKRPRPPKKAAAKTCKEHSARIVVLTGDPRRKVMIVPGCHLDSLRPEQNPYYLEDGNGLIGMVVEGGTVEYHADDHTYVVRLTDGRHAAE